MALFILYLLRPFSSKSLKMGTMPTSIFLISDRFIFGLSSGTFSPMGVQRPSFSIGMKRDLLEIAEPAFDVYPIIPFEG